MTRGVLDVLAYLCGWGFTLWLWASIWIRVLRLVGKRVWPVVRHFQAEVRPFALPLAVANWLPEILDGDMGPWKVGALAMNVICWVLYRNEKDDDDDRWKRRREKLASKVAEVGGRLQVVPAGASS